MAMPTTDEIKARATEKFLVEKGAQMEGEELNTPEENELKEGGYWEEARRELMSESGNLSPEEKELATRRKAELMDELKEVRESLGYKPRPKKEKVEELVNAAKEGSDQAAAGTITMATREELEALPRPVEERPTKTQRYPGRYVPELAEQRKSKFYRTPEGLIAVEEEKEELPTLEELAALPGEPAAKRTKEQYFPSQRPELPGEPAVGLYEKKQRFPGKVSREVVAAQRAAAGTQLVPTSTQKVERGVAATAGQIKGKIGALVQKRQQIDDLKRKALLELQADPKPQNSESLKRLRAISRTAAEKTELKAFEREVRLGERKRVLLARATARVEQETELAQGGYTGLSPARELARAIRRRAIRGLESTGAALGAGGEEEPRYPDLARRQTGPPPDERPENLERPSNYGGWSHHWPAYHFSTAHPKDDYHWDVAHPREPLHFKLGEEKPKAERKELHWHVTLPEKHWHRGAYGKTAKVPKAEARAHLRVEETFPGLSEKATMPSYLSGHSPYPFELVTRGDVELRGEMEREKEDESKKAQKRIEE